MSTRLSNFASALLGALTVAVVVVALALAGVFDDDDPAPASTSAATPATATAPATNTRVAEDDGSADGGASVADIYERERPGVVDVAVGAASASPLGGEGGASGSGFVLDREGYVLTNEHVVEDAETAQIRFVDQDRPVRAEVVGTDPSSDLALLKVDPAQVEDLSPLPLGSSATVRVGEQTIAMGSPFGLSGSLTTGVVSALDRSIPAPNNFQIDGAIQTDAAINPGNSGGPLLDADGRVIGINAQIRTSGGANSGVGFAIPIDTAKEVVAELKEDGEVERPYLGVRTGPTPNGTGVLVDSVTPGDPAAEAGLRGGDVILRVGGTVTNDPEDVAAAIADRSIGDRIEITLRRGGQERTVTVTLAERPDEVQAG
jgi:S1-C subfamily serine protease